MQNSRFLGPPMTYPETSGDQKEGSCGPQPGGRAERGRESALVGTFGTRRGALLGRGWALLGRGGGRS